jgi:hypothetical protein
VNQRPVNELKNITEGFKMRISTMKTKTIPYKGKNNISKTVLDNKAIKEVSNI